MRLLEDEVQELTERLEAVANKRKELDLAKDAEVASPSAEELSAKIRAALKKFRISVHNSGTGMRPAWAPTCASSWTISTKSSR